MKNLLKISFAFICILLCTISTLLLNSEHNVYSNENEVFCANGTSVYIGQSESELVPNETGIRFNIIMSTNLYNHMVTNDNFSTGVLIVPKDKLNGELNLNEAKNSNGLITIKDTTNLWQKQKLSINEYGKYYVDNINGIEYMTNYVYLYNIPQASYNRTICFRGYYDDGENVRYTATVERSIAYVSNKVLQSGEYEDDENVTNLLNSYVENYLPNENYVIILSKNASATEQYAAEELQKYIKEATNCCFDILTEDYDVMENKIYVGDTDALINAGGISADLGTDGFVLKSIDGNDELRDLFIAGGSDKGTLYGVYEFLESNLGIRFLTADETYIPDVIGFNIPEIDNSYVPDFENRMFYSKSTYRDKSFMSKVRMDCELVELEDNMGEDFAWDRNVVHTQLLYIPSTYYVDYDNNDESNRQYENYYSLFTRDADNNVKTVKRNSRTEPADICLTSGINPDGTIKDINGDNALAICLNTLKGRVLSLPETDYFVFTMMDTTKICECSRCAYDREKYKDSGILIRFANLLVSEVNEWIQQEHPERDQINLILLAYNQNFEPPVDSSMLPLAESCKPNEHLYIRIAPINMDCFGTIEDDKSNKNIGLYNSFTGWKSLTDNLFVWTYNSASNAYFHYFPTNQTYDDNFNLFKELGISYVFMQGDIYNQSNWQNKMETYIASKKLWDISLNSNELKNEYISLYYGPAKDSIQEFLNIFDQKYALINEAFWFYQGMYFSGVNATITNKFDKSFINNLINILDGAIRNIENSSLLEDQKEKYINRVKEVKITPLAMLIEFGFDFSDSELLKAKEELNNIANEFGISYLGESATLETILGDRHTVTFKSEGVQYGNSQKVMNGGFAIEPITPISSLGETFLYWTVNGEKVDISTYQILEDVEFVACFSTEFTCKDIYDDIWW